MPYAHSQCIGRARATFARMAFDLYVVVVGAFSVCCRRADGDTLYRAVWAHACSAVARAAFSRTVRQMPSDQTIDGGYGTVSTLFSETVAGKRVYSATILMGVGRGNAN